MIRSELLL